MHRSFMQMESLFLPNASACEQGARVRGEPGADLDGHECGGHGDEGHRAGERQAGPDSDIVVAAQLPKGVLTPTDDLVNLHYYYY